jgi:aminopeptidase N
VVKFDYTESDLTHLMAHDSDPFNRWEAGQRLATKILLAGVEERRAGRSPEFPQSFVNAFARVLADGRHDPAFAAEALSLPTEGYIGEQMAMVDPDAIHEVRVALRRHIAHALRSELSEVYQSLHVPGPYSPDARAAGQRSLRNIALAYLMEIDDAGIRARAMQQFETADNMTDTMAALSALANTDCAERITALEKFYSKWQGEPLVVDKWLAVQATSRLPQTLAEVKRLTGHPAFDIRNPNKVYSLVRGFAANPVRFHAADGKGYDFIAERVIELDRLNPQVASRVARSFDRWRKFDAGRQAQAREALERIRDAEGLSKDVAEVVIKALG